MKKTVLFSLALFAALSSFAQEITGTWIGEIDMGGNKLGFSFNINKEVDGYTSTMDIPKQGLNKAKADETSFEDSVLKIDFSAFKMSYQGKLNESGEITGEMSQGGRAITLNLKKGEIKLNRPQEPKAPFNYDSEEVTFTNSTENIKLAGTLTTPKGGGKHAAVIIISGSGPQDRDGAMFGHKLYYVIADHLAKYDIAVLRFDERGVGESEGDFKSAAINEFASDIEAGLAFLKGREDIDASKIGLIGHSIGGIIAPKVAAENEVIAFAILMAGPGIPGDELMLSQKAAAERLMGLNELQVAQGQGLMKGAYDIITDSELSGEALSGAVDAYFLEKYGSLIPEGQRKGIVSQITGNEVVSLLRSKPSNYLEAVKCPVLALNGSKDFQVPAEQNLKAIKDALAKGGNESVETMNLEGLNHLFQECETGSLQEYAEIEQTISPMALELMAVWIMKEME